MDRPFWAPDEVDIDRPNAARMYDYSLGGSHNFAADRELADRLNAEMPEGIRIAYANRAFLRRAVRLAATHGVRQFLDLGSGIPTVSNVHEVVRQLAPDARVVYVDRDPIAVAHGTAILDGDPQVRMVRGDVRDPEAILADPTVRRLLDFDQPIAVVLCAVLHFVPGVEAPRRIVGTTLRHAAAGSFLVISHGSRETPPDKAEAITEAYQRTSTPLSLRTRDEVTALFAGLDLLAPGVVPAPRWRPDPGDEPEDLPLLAGVARVPA